jgi:hypothetical protein
MPKDFDNNLDLHRLGALFVNNIGPDGTITGPAPLAIAFQKAYSYWISDNHFIPRTLLTESGTLMEGHKSAIYYLPTLPKTEPYDP